MKDGECNIVNVDFSREASAPEGGYGHAALLLQLAKEMHNAEQPSSSPYQMAEAIWDAVPETANEAFYKSGDHHLEALKHFAAQRWEDLPLSAQYEVMALYIERPQ